MSRTWHTRIRLYPRSLFWRLSGVTVLAMLLSLAFVVALFSYNRLQLVSNNVAEQCGELLANAEGQLDGLSPEDQADWIRDNQPPYTSHLRPFSSPEAPPRGSLPRSQLSKAIASALRRRLVGIGDIRESLPPRRQLWVEVDVLGKPYWLIIPMGRYRGDPTWQFAVAAGVFTLASLLMAALVAWHVNQPLRELRLAAGQLGRGERPNPLPESGPLEVKELSASFNRMLADLDANERERNVMLAGISHDLRTPLARLRLGVEMMSDDSLQDGMREDVEDIERILGQFIAFARGLGDEGAVETDPASLVRSVLARYAREGCDIELDLADDLPLIQARPLALSRALTNLIDNARRYGEPPLQLAVRHESGRLVFEVNDRGPGIPAAQLADALKPFHRLDSARRADGGSGLGFAIVDRITRLHRGTLMLRNRDGGGLSVQMWLPV